MRQEKYTMNEQGDPKELVVDKMIERFNDPEIPYKIKKTKLLETVGLPIPKTDYFEKTEIKLLEGKIFEELQAHDSPLVVRFACMPDKLSMPFFYLEKEMNDEEINKIVEKIHTLFESDSSVKYLILQEATPAEKTKDKISGRISFEKGEMLPTQEVLDIYKGARSTGILNNVNVNDPNFQTFIKKTGEFLKPTKKLDKDSLIKEEEIREIYNFLNLYREKIETIINIITKSKNKSVNDMTISLEFSYRDGKIVFSDIDF
ncbi:MAG: hypothetical protein PHY40_00420 [Patescibacteria group bacterium]|nr:hypothetical protein [Patescibacteria group bacterium]